MSRLTLRLRLHDLLARLRGRCNRAPLFMVDGGYHFWRCGLRRRHDGPCRTGNYWWGPGGSIYDPDTPHAPSVLKRAAGRETRRQRESRRRWRDLDDLKRAHEDRQAERAVEAAEAITAEPFKPVDGGDY